MHNASFPLAIRVWCGEYTPLGLLSGTWLLEKAQRAEGASYRKALNPVIAVTKEVADGEKNSDRSYEKNKGWNKPDRAGENIISKLHHACCLAPSIAFR